MRSQRPGEFLQFRPPALLDEQRANEVIESAAGGIVADRARLADDDMTEF